MATAPGLYDNLSTIDSVTLAPSQASLSSSGTVFDSPNLAAATEMFEERNLYHIKVKSPDTLSKAKLSETGEVVLAAEYQVDKWLGQLVILPPIECLISDISKEVLDRFSIEQRGYFQVFCAQANRLAPTLSHEVYRIFLLLAWSPALHEHETNVLRTWATGNTGREVHQLLRQSLVYPWDPISLALFISAWTSLERLRPSEYDNPYQPAAFEFHMFDLLSNKCYATAQAFLEDMILLFNTVAFNILRGDKLLEADKRLGEGGSIEVDELYKSDGFQIIHHLLSQNMACINLKAVETSKKVFTYWKYWL